eukprot:13737454-Alexandrium_andersonii.AAC.1
MFRGERVRHRASRGASGAQICNRGLRLWADSQLRRGPFGLLCELGLRPPMEGLGQNIKL